MPSATAGRPPAAVGKKGDTGKKINRSQKPARTPAAPDGRLTS
jgi:hypothetical protein